jgi:hypothetical protein
MARHDEWQTICGRQTNKLAKNDQYSITNELSKSAVTMAFAPHIIGIEGL